MTMTRFAIRVKGTECYLPDRHRRNRGFTNDEPLPQGGDEGPRLFITKRGAITALTRWLQGVHEVSRGMHSGPLNDPDYYEEVSIRPMPHRKAEDMEIVEFNLQEVRTYGRGKAEASQHERHDQVIAAEPEVS